MQLLQQVTQRAHFKGLQSAANNGLVHRQQGSGTEIAQQRIAIGGVPQNIVSVQVTVHHALLVQVGHGTRNVRRHLQRQRGVNVRAWQACRIDIAGAALQAGRAGQIDVAGGNEGQQQTLRALRVVCQRAAGRAQRRVLSGGQAGGQLVLGQPVTGDGAFEQFERQAVWWHSAMALQMCPMRHIRLINVAGRALAQ